MKNLFKVFLAAAAATALFACNKEIDNQEPDINEGVRTVEFATAPVTRTVFGTLNGTTLPTLWTANKTVGVSLNFADKKESTSPVVANEGATARFYVSGIEGGSAPYSFYAVSPNSAWAGTSSTNHRVSLDIAANQTPLENSVDEDAQVLVAKYVAGDTFPSECVLMNFAHLTAYGKISFKDLALTDGEAITTVALTASKNWAGRYYYYFEDNESTSNSEGDIAEYTAGATITLTTSSATNIWFACAPVDLGGETVKVTVTTDKATYVKNITIPAGKTFDSGKVNAFTIDMSGIAPEGPVDYELVTDAADLAEGDEVIIAAPGTVEYAISTTQNSNNRAQAHVTKSSDGTVITTPGDDVQIFTIEEGNQNGTLAFNTGDGYIYAASSSSNNLRTEATLTNNSSWTISIDSDGVATVVAQGSNTRNHLRYNSDSNIFSCYASTSSVDTKVSIYKASASTTWNLKSIAVTTEPDKTAYEAGEDFDATGMVVTATYEDASGVKADRQKVIANSDLTINPSANLTAGTTSVSISYGGQTTTQTITVSAPITWDLQGIAVKTAPTKTTYTAGQTFDPTGLVITATFENRDNTAQTKTEDVSDVSLFTFTPGTDVELTTSNTSVTIEYTVNSITKSTTQAITVNEPSTGGTTETFTIASSSVVSNSSYTSYTYTDGDSRGWVITCGGNNVSIGVNSKNRGNCTLSNYSKYAVSPVTTSSTASAFACTTSLSNVSKIKYTFNGGNNQTYTNVYLLYSSDNNTFSQVTLTSGTQGEAISSGTEFEFDECSGYFAVLFVATNTSGNWRIDNVELEFTYTE